MVYLTNLAAVLATTDVTGGLTTSIVELINSFTGPALMIVGAVGTLYCIIIGVKYAKAEEPQEREKAKGTLKYAIVGFLLIFILIAALNIMMDPMRKWAEKAGGTKITGFDSGNTSE